MFADWGPLDNSYIYPVCLAAILTALLIFFTATLGIVGVYFQQAADKYGDEVHTQDTLIQFNEMVARTTKHVSMS